MTELPIEAMSREGIPGSHEPLPYRTEPPPYRTESCHVFKTLVYVFKKRFLEFFSTHWQNSFTED